MKKLRVIQWTTGKVGKMALRAILDDPRLELAGVYAYGPDKAGVDAGKLCGRANTGVLASNDIEALIALQADTVIYAPFVANLDHAVRLLEAGLDVISTNLFLNVGGIQGETKARLAAACVQGNSSFYVSGINPGWVNAMVVGMTAICRQVDCVAVTESADCSVYESVETWSTLGMGLPEATPAIHQAAYDWMIMFRDTLFRMAEALGFEIEDTAFTAEFATAAETVDLGWFRMEKGTNAAIRAGWSGKINGKTVVQNKVIWYLTKNLAEGWEIDNDQYHIVITGVPDVNVKIRMTPPPHWTHGDWDSMTALPAVSAAPDIKAAKPGILGLKDAGLPWAPAGAWLVARG
jgi:2,4-diaminopentanoate dehydrogenase